MIKFLLSKDEFDALAKQICLPIVKTTYEDTCASVEAWRNNAAIFNDRFMNRDKCRDSFLCVAVKR